MRFYRAVVRPLAFGLPPETAHRLAGAMLRIPVPWGIIGGAARDERLRVSVAGLDMYNPVGMAAGFDKNCRFLDSLGRLGFGYVVGGTVTADPRPGNAKPRIARRPKDLALVNAMGFPNRGAVAARQELERRRRTAPTLVSLSDAGVDNLMRSYDLLAPHADGVEVNVSCPNVAWGRDRDAEGFLREVLTRLPARRHGPLFVKIPPYHPGPERTAIMSLVRIARDLGTDGITASNTFPITSPEMAMGSGGLSGKVVFKATLRIVRDIYQEMDGAVPINACGGIFTAEDALACIRAGATTVQVYTGLIYEGPGIVRRITEGLIRAMGATGGPVISLVGAAA